MPHATRRMLLALLACLGLAACASLGERAQSLESAQRIYEGALRWGHYDIVYALHDAGTPPPELARYKLTAYRILSSEAQPDQGRAEQVVEIRYYHVDYMQERTLTDRQHWVYDAARKRWSLRSPPPPLAVPPGQ